MEPNQSSNEKQPAKRTAFTIMNNVRDHCGQPWARKSLLLLVATYANADGICYPSNALLARAAGMSSRTVQRILAKLKADGELDIVTVGAGREQKRIIRLKRYGLAWTNEDSVTGVTVTPKKHVTALSPLDTSQLCHPNNHVEQPTLRNGNGSRHETVTRPPAVHRHFWKRPKIAYPESEQEMHAVLEALGIEPNPDYDGDFFAQMDASAWTIRGEPIRDWPAVYVARLERTQPGL
jgi:hypothetical protein